MECLQTNINGSVHIAKAAIKNECKAVIGISSTRAAMPVSGIYGMSKSFMERIFYDFNAQSDVQFMNVRLGNIAWAPSSVLDDWKIMLDATGIIKTTGYNMSRLFLTINETADIMDVIFSNSEKFAGFTVVPDMKTAKIGDILHKFIETFGGQYESLPPLVPEKKDDYLIGQEEISYTKSVRLDNRLFYLVSLVKQDELLANNLDFFQGMKMSDTEIIQMITGSPKKVLSYKI
jgi:FlaA1/EpsC-like NDP-sugar epimerase